MRKSIRFLYCSLIIISASVELSGADNFCFNQAGSYYHVSPILLQAISKVESSHNPYALNINRNGTMDVCHMQVNSCWKDDMGPGWDYLGDPCYCTYWGAYILSKCVSRYGQSWDAVSCYNSNRSLNELKGSKYEQNVIKYVNNVAKEVSRYRDKERQP